MSDGGSDTCIDLAHERQRSGRPVPDHAPSLLAYLDSPSLAPSTIIRTDGEAIVLDLGRGSMALGESLAGLSTERFGKLVDRVMCQAGTGFAYGRWGERREVYTSELFAGEEGAAMRDVHLGIDLFCAAGTPVYAPLAGRVQITANNAGELDYGPLLVLAHDSPAGHEFYSLYGHLELHSIAPLTPGQPISAGQPIARIGAPPENGNWPPHLHFQLILDLLKLGADYPGVAYPHEQEIWLALSPLPSMFFPDCDARLLDGRAADA